MPDISMCANRACPGRGKCYRYLARPSMLTQSYAVFEPEDERCDYFMGLFVEDKVRDVAAVDTLNAEAEEQG